MSSINNQSMAGTMLPGRSGMLDPRYSSQVKEQSLSFYESLEAGLTIETKEGDVVSLSSSSYAGLDAYMYDSSGVLQSSSGEVSASQNVREITLATGESFSFTVTGDLSEEELSDIEAIVLGIDQIIAEVAEGDMDDAVAKALAMGDYDTVSMYSADISYQRAYAARSEVQTQEGAVPGYFRSQAQNRHRNENAYRLFEKMAEEVEKYDAKQLEKAQKPLDKLFAHYLEKESNDSDEAAPRYREMETARNRVMEMIEEMTRDMFRDGFSDIMDT